MSMFEIDISEMKKLDRAFKRMSGIQIEKVNRNAMSAGARIIRDEAKRRSPVRTGRLRKSIKLKRRRSRRNVIQVSMTAAPHWHLVEYGTAERKPKSKRIMSDPSMSRLSFSSLKGGRKRAGIIGVRAKAISPRPFVRPALDDNRTKYLRVYKKRATNEINKILKRNFI